MGLFEHLTVPGPQATSREGQMMNTPYDKSYITKKVNKKMSFQRTFINVKQHDVSHQED